MRKFHPLLPITALASAIFLSGCGAQASVTEATPEISRKAVTVEVAEIQRGSHVEVYRGTGTLTATRDSTVLAESDGEVLWIGAEEGDLVKAGASLLRLDAERQSLRATQARIARDRSQHEAARAERLAERHLLGRDALDRARYERDGLQAQHALDDLSVRKADVQAPFAGTVTHRHVKLGQRVRTGDALFSVADFQQLELALEVAEGEAARMAVGQPAALHFDALPGRSFKAEVLRLRPVVDPSSGTRTVTLAVQVDPSLRPGLHGRAEIRIRELSDTLLVPRAAVLLDQLGHQVFVINAEGEARRRRIELIGHADAWSAVQSGLEAGDQVVVLGQQALSDGDLVEVIEQTRLTKPVASR